MKNFINCIIACLLFINISAQKVKDLSDMYREALGSQINFLRQFGFDSKHLNVAFEGNKGRRIKFDTIDNITVKKMSGKDLVELAQGEGGNYLELKSIYKENDYLVIEIMLNSIMDRDGQLYIVITARSKYYFQYEANNKRYCLMYKSERGI